MKKIYSTTRHTLKLWALTIAFLVAHPCYALGLGDIQVSSFLGEPLMAQVDLIDVADDYETAIKVRLASAEKYRQDGYAYPYHLKYKFTIVNETGKQPRIRISSSQLIEDPYLNILLEVSTPSGRITRMFTVLIDPSPEMLRNQETVLAVSQSEPQPSPSTSSSKPVESVATQEVVAPAGASKNSDRPASAPRTHQTHAVTHTAKIQRAQVHRDLEHASGRLAGRLSLSLSTTLSISNGAPTVGSKENSDALQEELIAKEKTLSELNTQIAEMKTLIKGLQMKLSLTTASGVSASGMLAQSGMGTASVVAAVATVSEVAMAPPATLTVTAPLADAKIGKPTKLPEQMQPQGIWAGLSILLLGSLAFYVWRKRESSGGQISVGLFDDLSHSQTRDTSKVTPAVMTVAVQKVDTQAMEKAVVTKTLPMGEQSMKVPSYKEQNLQSALPPEYDLLEEADIYLRFGHDRLAEEVLRDALKINAANPQIYVTLLGIFDTRGDAQGFEAVARELQPLADAETWGKVVAMGKTLDIGNALYK